MDQTQQRCLSAGNGQDDVVSKFMGRSQKVLIRVSKEALAKKVGRRQM